jgi:hypothetical protein
MTSAVPASPSRSADTDDFVALEHPSASSHLASTPTITNGDAVDGVPLWAGDEQSLPPNVIQHSEPPTSPSVQSVLSSQIGVLPTVSASPPLSGQADNLVPPEHPSGSSFPAIAKEDSIREETSLADTPPHSFIQHDEFFLQDAHVKLVVCDSSSQPYTLLTFMRKQVGNTLFRVHGFFFERESEKSRSLLRESTDRDGVITIDGIEAVDLARFLKVLYCRWVQGRRTMSSSYIPLCSAAEQPGLFSKDEWTSVLALAHRWHFASIRALAVRKLLPITTPVDQIVLAARYAIDHWKPNAYLKICEQDAWLSPEDCRRVGLEELIKIGEARQALRSPTMMIAPSEREAVITSVFSLPREVRSSASPAMHAGLSCSSRRRATNCSACVERSKAWRQAQVSYSVAFEMQKKPSTFAVPRKRTSGAARRRRASVGRKRRRASAGRKGRRASVSLNAQRRAGSKMSAPRSRAASVSRMRPRRPNRNAVRSKPSACASRPSRRSCSAVCGRTKSRSLS